MPGSISVVAIDDVLVHLGTTPTSSDLTVSISCKRVGGAVGLERPDLHLTEALTTELRLTAQRLLRNEAVRSGGTRVHLVVDEVVQLQHVHVADRDRAIESLAGATVVQRRLTAVGRPGQLQQTFDFGSSGAPSNTGVAIGTPPRRFVRELENFLVGERLEILDLPPDLVVDLIEELAYSRTACAALRASHRSLAEPFAAQPRCVSRIWPTFMRDGTPSGFSTMSTGVPSLEVRHVFDRHDGRDHTLVAVAAGHLVAGLHAALDGQVDLDHLEHARGEVVAASEAWRFFSSKRALKVCFVLFNWRLGCAPAARSLRRSSDES